MHWSRMGAWKYLHETEIYYLVKQKVITNFRSFSLFSLLLHLLLLTHFGETPEDENLFPPIFFYKKKWFLCVFSTFYSLFGRGSLNLTNIFFYMLVVTFLKKSLSDIYSFQVTKITQIFCFCLWEQTKYLPIFTEQFTQTTYNKNDNTIQ